MHLQKFRVNATGIAWFTVTVTAATAAEAEKLALAKDDSEWQLDNVERDRSWSAIASVGIED